MKTWKETAKAFGRALPFRQCDSPASVRVAMSEWVFVDQQEEATQ
ncbi:hypothetical protein SAMN04488094_104137 [Tropicimonas isoalkanivorans]|uniref:Uncharacterized protein n=1 Tax=Tropicimonas isoalkanivorans TaxID=441112 RepID=A0A1I1IMV2_9RHOB|nr:hypothetical protein SAMN04488094_104137 [Tropicimonas isoalkanivorans]